MLPVDFPQQVGGVTDAKGRREKLHELLTEILNSVAEKEPALIVMHSMQWCDNSSLALLRHFMTHCRGVMFVLTSRTPASQCRFEDGVTNVLLELEPLRPDHAIRLVKKT